VLIVGKNLDGLVQRYQICPQDLVDQFSLKLKIDCQIRRMKSGSQPLATVTYGHSMNAAPLFEELENCSLSIELKPQAKLLACSDADYSMPAGYFGLIQTKGTLARLFVSCTCNDGQVEPGYRGKITLEVMNQSNYTVLLPVGAEVAQIFLFKCSGDADGLYDGKYQGAKSPTLPIFKAITSR
jgi:dCTP deaminase